MTRDSLPADTGFTLLLRSGQINLASRTHVMGVLNVTPDSFSDGGRFDTPARAIEHGLRMAEDGADFIDVGGESTRPKGQAYGEGGDPVGEEEELRRVLPVIEGLARRSPVPISIDTYRSRVAREALRAGASIVNDISAFHFDPAMPAVVAEADAAAVLMHIRGTPKTMQSNPVYRDLWGEILAYLQEGIERARASGVRQLLVDPGIGFGKTAQQNLRLIAELRAMRPLGLPILVGPSRKSFIGEILGLPVAERLEGTLAAVVGAVLNGAHVVRVHDVREAVRAVRVADALKSAPVAAH
jgi:dihydropteroate synthase